MPKTTAIQTNFTAGEISPRLLGRIDIDKYRNAAELMFNCRPLVHGGCVRRGGLRHVAITKHADRLARLIPFVVSKSTAFQLEVGHLYMRFCTNAIAQVESSPGVPYEIVSPYQEADLDGIHYVQGSRVMYLAHENYPVYQLTRTADTDWKLVAVPFEFSPTDEIPQTYNTTATLSATTGAITINAGAAAFLASDVGRDFVVGNGRAVITAFSSTTAVNATVVDAFASVGAHAAGTWSLGQSPKCSVTPSVSGPVGVAVNATASANAWQNNAQYSHIGKFIRVNGGIIEITGVTSATVAAGIVRAELSSTLAVGADGWTLENRIWNSTLGYPKAVGLYQQRLVLGGSASYPQTVWGSAVRDLLNFAVGDGDGDAFDFTIQSDQVNPVEHITNTKALAVLTEGGEVTMRGGQEKALSTLNVQAETQSAYGCNSVRPIRVGNEILFWTRSGLKLRAMAYQVENDSFRSPDMTILAEHISSPGGAIEMSYAQEPDSVIHTVRADGVLIDCTFDRDQNVTGWSSHGTDGVFESTSANPASAADQSWHIVARVVEGAIVRSIEVEDTTLNTDFAITGSNFRTVEAYDGYLSGSAQFELTAHGFVGGETIRLRNFLFGAADLNGDHVVQVIDVDHFEIPVADPGALVELGEAAFGAITWAGFDYAEGRTFKPLADGSPQNPATVTGGEITLDRAAYELEAGLEYSNYVDVLPIEQPTQFGTAQGAAISVSRYVCRFYRTIGATINGVQIPARSFGLGVLDQTVQPFTGDIDLSKVGWEKSIGGRVRIGQDLPLPWQLLAVIREVTVNQ